MNKKYLYAFILALAMTTASCANKNESNDSAMQSEEISVSTFDDFQFLMYTENDISVIRDKDGNEYTVSTDGYYYDTNGNKIIEYGAGDDTTAKIGRASGALNKGEKADKSNPSKNNIVDKLSGNGSSNEDNVVEQQSEVIVNDGLNNDFGMPVDEIVDGWNSYKKDYIEENGGEIPGQEKWHDVKDEMKEFQADKGDATLKTETTYKTNIDVADNIPADVNLDSIVTTGSGKVSGKIQLDGDLYNDYGIELYGEPTTNEDGEELKYSDVLIGNSIDVYMIASDGTNTIMSDPCTVTFDENYQGNFNCELDIPEGYHTGIIINGTIYNLS